METNCSLSWLVYADFLRARNFLSNSLVPSDKYNVFFACPNHKTTCPKTDSCSMIPESVLPSARTEKNLAPCSSFLISFRSVSAMAEINVLQALGFL